MNQQPLTQSANQTVAGLLDSRRLALHCMQLESTVEEQRQRGAALEQQITSLQDEHEQLRPLAEAGRGEIERLRQETLSRTRAAAQFTGDRERVRIVEDALNDGATSPDTVRRLHRAATSEFCALYPTRPVSRFVEENAAGPNAVSFASFQMPGNHPNP